MSEKNDLLLRYSGLTIDELIKENKYYLFEDFLPFMDKYIVDRQYGGFMCNTDREGRKITTNKRAWFDGRGIWVYSFLYNNFHKDPDFLDIAKRTVDLVLSFDPLGEGFMPWSYTRGGVPLEEKPGDIYGNLFVAEGLGQYSVATGESDYWDMAKAILLKCLNNYDDINYSYTVIDFGPDAPFIKAPRVLGHWMIMLRLATGLLNIRNDEDVERIARRCIDALFNYHHIPAYDLFNEVLNHDLSRAEDPYSQFVCTGHTIEAMWMVMDEAMRRKDPNLFNLAVKHFKRHVEVAWDDVYRGIFRCILNVDQNIWSLERALWAQQETLIGILYILEQTGDQWAYEWFGKMHKYVIENYPLQKYGYSLWNFGADRKVTFKKDHNRVENYHHPRYLMLSILCLQKMLDK